MVKTPFRFARLVGPLGDDLPRRGVAPTPRFVPLVRFVGHAAVAVDGEVAAVPHGPVRVLAALAGEPVWVGSHATHRIHTTHATMIQNEMSATVHPHVVPQEPFLVEVFL